MFSLTSSFGIRGGLVSLYDEPYSYFLRILVLPIQQIQYHLHAFMTRNKHYVIHRNQFKTLLFLSLLVLYYFWQQNVQNTY